MPKRITNSEIEQQQSEYEYDEESLEEEDDDEDEADKENNSANSVTGKEPEFIEVDIKANKSGSKPAQ